MAWRCLTISQCADLLICVTECCGRKHRSCVFEDLVPIFEEGESTSEGKILGCSNCYYRVCINGVIVSCAYADVGYDRCIDSMRGGTVANSRITCWRRLVRGPFPMSLSVRTTHDHSCEMRLHVSLEQKHVGGELLLTSIESHYSCD